MKAKRMKSIKEMAEKYVEERRDLDVGHANAQFNCFNMIDAVKFGANYVLECFESTLPFVAKKGIIYGKIKETIEQLKK